MKVLTIKNDPATVESVSLDFQLRWADATSLSTGRGRESMELVGQESPDVVMIPCFTGGVYRCMPLAFDWDVADLKDKVRFAAQRAGVYRIDLREGES